MSSTEEDTDGTQESYILDEVCLDSQHDVAIRSPSQELVEMDITVKRHLQHVSDIEQRLNERDKFIEYIISKLSLPQKRVITEQWKLLQANQGN